MSSLFLHQIIKVTIFLSKFGIEIFFFSFLLVGHKDQAENGKAREMDKVQTDL